jgi:hypothetical protein
MTTDAVDAVAVERKLGLAKKTALQQVAVALDAGRGFSGITDADVLTLMAGRYEAGAFGEFAKGAAAALRKAACEIDALQKRGARGPRLRTAAEMQTLRQGG